MNLPIVLMATLMMVQASQQRRSFESVQSEVEQQGDESRPVMGVQNKDPFWNEWEAFQKKENEWRNMDRNLDQELADLPTCDPSVLQKIQRVLDLSFASFAAQQAYYKKWRDIARNDRTLFLKLISDRTALKSEIESSLAGVNNQISDLLSRKEALSHALESTKSTSGGNEMRALDALIKSSQDRIRNYEGALKKWSDAAKGYDDAVGTVEKQDGYIGQLQSLLQSEVYHWRTYYEVRDARARLRCVEDRQPQTWKREMPPD